MTKWVVEKIVHFASDDLVKNGLSHFGFHDRAGSYYAIFHQKHCLGLIGNDDELKWTVAAKQILEGTPNIKADLNFPMYIDSFPDGTLVVSNFGDARLYHIDPANQKAKLLVDGQKLGMKDAGNCVVDDEGFIWINEVKGCRIWRLDTEGKPVLVLGNGTPGFQMETVSFENARFNWIYDIRRGPEGNIYILDSKNFTVRLIDLNQHIVKTIAGTGKPGYDGDNRNALMATFGSDPSARFDGPISLSLDEEGNIFIGDRMNHVVRMINKKTGIINTIAGNHHTVKGLKNNPTEKDPLKLNLPEISSMDYYQGQLFVPTDLTPEEGDLTVLAHY